MAEKEHGYELGGFLSGLFCRGVLSQRDHVPRRRAPFSFAELPCSRSWRSRRWTCTCRSTWIANQPDHADGISRVVRRHRLSTRAPLHHVVHHCTAALLACWHWRRSHHLSVS